MTLSCLPGAAWYCLVLPAVLTDFHFHERDQFNKYYPEGGRRGGGSRGEEEAGGGGRRQAGAACCFLLLRFGPSTACLALPACLLHSPRACPASSCPPCLLHPAAWLQPSTASTARGAPSTCSSPARCAARLALPTATIAAATPPSARSCCPQLLLPAAAGKSMQNDGFSSPTPPPRSPCLLAPLPSCPLPAPPACLPRRLTLTSCGSSPPWSDACATTCRWVGWRRVLCVNGRRASGRAAVVVWRQAGRHTCSWGSTSTSRQFHLRPMLSQTSCVKCLHCPLTRHPAAGPPCPRACPAPPPPIPPLSQQQERYWRIVGPACSLVCGRHQEASLVIVDMEGGWAAGWVGGWGVAGSVGV